MNLAVVGSVKLTPAQRRHAAQLIDRAILQYAPVAIVSGGAPGIDTLAEERAAHHGLPVVVCKPARQGWKWFKARNLLVAEIGDAFIRIHSSQSKTYGSGWTVDRAEEMGKPVERYEV